MQILEQVQDLPKAGNIRAQWVCLWSGPAVGLVLLVALVAFPGFWPPMSPTLPAEEVARFYAENTAWIRFSQVTFNLCGIMVVPFFMVIVAQMKRMHGQSHVFAYCYLTALVSGATFFALSNIFFLVAAFRPERDPELTMLLNDLAWIVSHRADRHGVLPVHAARGGGQARHRPRPGRFRAGSARIP